MNSCLHFMYQMDLEMLFHFALALEMDVIPF